MHLHGHKLDHMDQRWVRTFFKCSRGNGRMSVSVSVKNHVKNTYSTGYQPFRATVSRQAIHKTCRLRRKRLIVAQYVGERGSNASQYHDNDFDWNICAEEGRMAVARQRAEYAQLEEQKSTLVQQQPNVLQDHDDGAYSHKWEEFHGIHSTGRFFKEKRYLTRAFPRLLEQDPRSIGQPHRIGEIGCGCGSALIPVLRENSEAIAVACDVSSTAIGVFNDMCLQAGIDAGRVQLFVHSAGQPESVISSPFSKDSIDTMMVIFTLSAFHPRDMQAVLKQAWDSLESGGFLLIRDYGLYDMAHLRFTGKQLVDPEYMVYRRAEGTLSYFFSVEALQQMTEQAGFSTHECKYVTTYVTNLKKNRKMRRVFIHGVFEKP